MEERDQKIFDRYIYWTETRNVRFDYAVKILSEDEFFLTENVIIRIIRAAIRSGKTDSQGRTGRTSRIIGVKQKMSSRSQNGELLFLFDE